MASQPPSRTGTRLGSGSGTATELQAAPAMTHGGMRFVVVAAPGSPTAKAAMDGLSLPAAALSTQPDPYLALAEIGVIAHAQVSRSAWGLARLGRTGVVLTDDDGLGPEGRAALVAAVDRFVPDLEVLVHEGGVVRALRSAAAAAHAGTGAKPDRAKAVTNVRAAPSEMASHESRTQESHSHETGSTVGAAEGTRFRSHAPHAAPSLRLTETVLDDESRSDSERRYGEMAADAPCDEPVTRPPATRGAPPELVHRGDPHVTVSGDADDGLDDSFDDPLADKHDPLIARVTSEELSMLLDPPVDPRPRSDAPRRDDQR